MSILIWKDGQQLGPFSEVEILEQVRSGRISRNDLAWTEGYSDWKPLSEIVRIDFQPPPPPPASRALPTDSKPAISKEDLSRATKAFTNTILAHAVTTAGLTQKQAYRKKLEFVDLRQADSAIGRKAFESGLILPGQEAVISQLKELSNEIAALKLTNVRNPTSLVDKTRATAQATANAAKIEALTFKQNQLFRELGATLRQALEVEKSLAGEIDAAKLISQKIQALDSEIENLGSRTYWWARRPLWIVAGLLAAAAVWIAVSLISSVANQWEIDRQKQRIKAQFDAYQQGAAALMESMKRREADSAAAAQGQMRQAQRAQEEALRQQNEQQAQQAERWRQAQQAAAQAQSRKQQATAEQQTERNEIPRPDQAAAEARQKAKREQLAKIAVAPPSNSAAPAGTGEPLDSPEVSLAATFLGKWTRDENKRVISADGSRTVLVVPSGSRVQAWVDGHAGPACRDVLWRPERSEERPGLGSALPISPDSKRVVYLAALDGGGVSVVADSTQSPVYKEIEWIGYGPRGHHIAYVVKIPDEEPNLAISHDRFFMVDNGNAGPLFSRIAAESITFSADGQHLAYIGEAIPPKTDSFNTVRPHQCCVVLDGKEQKHYGYIQSLGLTHDGSHCSYLTSREYGAPTEVVIDGQQSRSYKSIKGFFMSEDGSRAALLVATGDPRPQEFVVDNGNPGPGFLAIGEVAMSENGSRLAYVARKPAGNHTDTVVVDNGATGPAYDECGQIQMSPGGKTLCYVATAAQRTVLVANGTEFGPFYSLNTRVAFSPDGNHWACGVQEGDQQFSVILDGEQKTSVPMNRGDTLSFESDNKHLVLHTQRAGNRVEVDCFTGSPTDTALHSKDGKRNASVRGNGAGAHVTVDGIDGPEFRSISDLAMSPDSLHVAYVAQDNPSASYVVVDGTKGPPFEQILETSSEGQAHQLNFRPDGALTFLAVTGGKLFRFTYSADALKSMPSLGYINTVTSSVRDLCSVNDALQLRPALATGPNGTFFGITRVGGQYGNGSLFSCSDNGTEPKILHSFYGHPNDGQQPSSIVSTPDGEIYGTTESLAIFHYSIKTSKYTIAKISENIGRLVAVLEDGSLLAQSAVALSTIKPDGSDLKTGRQNSSIRAAALGPDGAIYCVTNDSVTRQSMMDSPPTILHQFVRSPDDGSDPGPLLVFDPRGSAFGYTDQGGANDHGIIFRIDPDGTYKILANLGPAERVGGLVSSDQGILYGLYQSASSQASGFFALPSDGGKLTTIAAHAEIDPENPMIYRDFVIYGCGRESIFRFQVPRENLAERATPTVKTDTIQPPPLASIPIVFTSPQGESSYYDTYSPDGQAGSTGIGNKFARGSADNFNPRPGAGPQDANAPTREQPSSVDNPQGNLILRLSGAMDAHDYGTVLSFIPNGRADYFGHKNASSAFIEKDMQGDARNYRWAKSIPNLSTFRTSTDGSGIVHESIQMETSAEEVSGRHHHAFVQMDISYRDEDPPSILSMDLRVIR